MKILISKGDEDDHERASREVFRRGKVVYGIYLPSISGNSWEKIERFIHL